MSIPIDATFTMTEETTATNVVDYILLHPHWDNALRAIDLSLIHI